MASPAAYTPRHLAERILAGRSALEGEIKQATVVFCDLCDSTALAERLGPERMHELLDRFFERAMAAVHRYEGTINQFLGDGFMALFGAPIALEDHVRRALFASVDMRQALDERPLWSGETVRLRIGINTGSVVVGKIGDDLRADYTAVGDVTNVAARLQHAAVPGEILVGAATRRLADTSVRFEALGAMQLHGRTVPVDAYRLISAGSLRSPMRGGDDRVVAPLVGRANEMRTLAELLDTAERGQGKIVGLVGEPGIGKSRLITEFRRSLAPDRITYLEARAQPFRQAVPYALVLDLLRANCGVTELDTAADAAAKIRHGLTELNLFDDVRAAALLTLLGIREPGDESTPEVVKRRAFDTLRAMALQGSRRRPLVFVLEDLHWVDAASDDFFSELVEHIAGAPILVIATYRPGHSPPWMARSNATQLALGVLSGDESAQLVRGVSDVPDATARAIVQRGEGNPLFLEELARGAEEAGGDESPAIPATIHDIIAARIDRLSEHAKHLLQIAAVVGREFSLDLLDAIWDGPRPIEPWLRSLTRGEFLYQHIGQDGDPYAFRHALTQDVAYASLLERNRRAWHRAVGGALETHPGASVDLLAHHYGLSDDDDRAVDYAIRAGERAQRQWANAEALGYFARALARLESGPESPANVRRRIDAVLKQSEVRFALGQHAEHLATLEGVATLVHAVDDPALRAAWHFWVGYLHVLTGARAEIAIDHCEQAARIARSHGLPAIEARAQSCLAQVSLFTGRLRNGLDVGERAVASFEANGDRWWAGRTLGQLSPLANGLGEWDRALDYGRRALAHAHALDDQRLKIMALLRLASTQAQRGDGPEALRLCDDAQALGPGPFDAATERAMRGFALVRCGRTVEGTSLLEEVVAWLERSRLRYTHCQMALWLAEAYARDADTSRARAVLEPVLAACVDLGYHHLEGVAARSLGVITKDAAAARAHLERALTCLRDVGADNDVARACEALAELEGRVGRSDRADRYRSEARTIFARLGTLQ